MPWAKRQPPFGRIGRYRHERISPLIDSRAAEHPELAGTYEVARAARDELRSEIAKDREREVKATEITISRQAAGWISVALEEYAMQLEGRERELDELQRRIRDAGRAYATAAGNRADGQKERVLRRFFDEPEPLRGQRFDVRKMAIDYMRLRRQSGDLIFGARQDAPESRVWLADGCPKSKPESLRGIAWLHDAASADAAAQALRRFARAEHDPLEEIDDVIACLDEDFPRRKSSNQPQQEAG